MQSRQQKEKLPHIPECIRGCDVSGGLTLEYIIITVSSLYSLLECKKY